MDEQNISWVGEVFREDEMKIALVGIKDYANVAYNYQEALRSVGSDATAYMIQPPAKKIQYDKHAGLFDKNKIYNSDVIIFMHSHSMVEGFEIGKNPDGITLKHDHIKDKKLIVFHGGTTYRRGYKVLNQKFRDMGITKVFIQTLDLWNLGAKNKHWVLPTINTNMIKPEFMPMRERRIIAHYPHKSYFKGSKTINDVMTSLSVDTQICNKFTYLHDDDVIKWNDYIDKLRWCDVYIESLSQAENENPHDWSVTALEAAALGKIVVTNMMDYGRYVKEYGPCAIQVANDKNSLSKVINRLISMNEIDFQKLKWETRKWVIDQHSYKAMGTRLKKLIEE